jgi:hypothetical protein
MWIKFPLNSWKPTIKISGDYKVKLMKYCVTCLDLTHLMFFLEHHLNQSKLDLIHIDNFALGAKYCRKNSKGKC